MTAFMQNLKSTYSDMLIGLNPIVDEWPFMKSPVPVLMIVACYLYFVLHYGPKFMENRKPFELQKLLVFYNGYQVIYSIWLCSQVQGIDDIFGHVLSLGCQQPDSKLEYALHRAAYWYFISKAVELLDTVFFVLRKKQNQVTFLHVYHHSITCLFSWGYLKYLPGEQGIVIGFLNSFVHIIMYFYYMVAAMGPKYQKYIWWKKYMTWIQLIQFSIMLTYLLSIMLFGCRLPLSLTIFFVTNVIIFMSLFIDFYRTAYAKKQKLNIHQNGSVPQQNGVNLDVKINGKKSN